MPSFYFLSTFDPQTKNLPMFISRPKGNPTKNVAMKWNEANWHERNQLQKPTEVRKWICNGSWRTMVANYVSLINSQGWFETTDDNVSFFSWEMKSSWNVIVWRCDKNNEGREKTYLFYLVICRLLCFCSVVWFLHKLTFIELDFLGIFGWNLTEKQYKTIIMGWLFFS